jgi:hypothetical protein
MPHIVTTYALMADYYRVHYNLICSLINLTDGVQLTSIDLILICFGNFPGIHGFMDLITSVLINNKDRNILPPLKSFNLKNKIVL